MKKIISFTDEVVMIDENVVYGSGDAMEKAGAHINAKCPACIDVSAAQSISAEALLEKLADGSLKDTEAYRSAEALVLKSETTYRGNGACIIADVVIENAHHVVLDGVAVKGDVKINNSQNVIIYSSCINGNAELYGDDVTIQNCKVCGKISAKGTDVIVRENTVKAQKDDVAVMIMPGTVNALVALNDIEGAQSSVIVDKAYNASVVVNRAVNIKANDTTNIYVVDNNVGGYVELTNNNYVICDGNSYPSDSLIHGLVAEGNDNVNGNEITDINARPEFGANEDILPHTNKDLFVGMKRKDYVTDASLDEPASFTAYLKKCCSASDVCIIPPGVYTFDAMIYIDGSCSNTTVYAYGVYSECSHTEIQSYKRLFLYHLFKADNMKFYGLTIGTAVPQCGQIRILDTYVEADGVRYKSDADVPEGKTAEYKLTAVNDAGFYDGFTTTNPETYHTWWPETFLVGEDGEHRMYPEENPDAFHECTRNYDENGNYDGTLTVTLLDKPEKYHNSWKAKKIYDRIKPGTIMTCRWGSGGYHIYNYGSNNVLFRDCVLYGYAGGMANVAMETDNIYYDRFHDALHGQSLIDKETYEKYLAIQNKWGVDMEIREETMPDGSVRYRGASARSSNVDGFHITHTKTGFNVISSLLEGMVDDGSNQKGNSSRLHAIRDNGDGTTTIEYKPTMFQARWVAMHRPGAPENPEMSFMHCRNFNKGNIVFVYAPSGKVLVESPALTDFVPVGPYTTRIGKYAQDVDVYATTVATKDVDFSALNDPITGIPYDLSDDDHIDENGKYNHEQRMTVDNLSYNACAYTMDNVMVRHGHSRGYLIKSADVVVKHCTFRNVSYAGLLIKPEKVWAESSITRRLLVTQTLFDNTGYMSNFVTEPEFACITMVSTSKIAHKDMLPIDDITITKCKFTNNKQRNAIYINSAKNIKIVDNVFDDNVYEIQPEDKGVAVLLNTCGSIELSRNKYNYAHYNGDINNVVKGRNYFGIHGTDVVDENGNTLIPDNVE